MIGTLMRAVQQHGLDVRKLEDDPGLQETYKMGLLHAVKTSDEMTHYSFPSMVHHR